MRRPVLPPGTRWSTTLDDPRVGAVRLTGWQHQLGGGEVAGTTAKPSDTDGERDTALVLVHGLGGCADSAYMVVATAAAAALAATPAGRRLATVLRFSVRGADRSGADLYHAGLTADLHAVLAARELAGYRRVLVLGFSLGGHLALRFGSETGDRRLAAVGAICPPLDLAAGADALDQPRRSPYRRYLMNHLHDIYAAVASRRELAVSVDAVRRLRHIRAFDDATVAPRFGFSGAADYYANESAGPRLGNLRVPTLLVASAHDPMVPIETLRPFLATPPAALTVRVLNGGGHVAFPAGLARELDLDAAHLAVGQVPAGSERPRANAPIEAAVIRWLLAAGERVKDHERLEGT